MLDFEISGSVISESSSTRVMVIGVGGAGGNTVNALLQHNKEGYTCVAINTDTQALELSRADIKVRIGGQSTKGRGAGADPLLGRAAAEESVEELIRLVQGYDLVFLTGGLGGGTGSGALPIIAQILKEHDILSVCIATKPFAFEGKKRMLIADQAEGALKGLVDILISIPNERLVQLNTESELSLIDAFGIVNGMVSDCVRGIVDIIMKPGHINVDFSDIKTVIKGMGTALMGTARARGTDRAEQAAHIAITSPFFDGVSMRGARSILINVTGNHTLGLQEIKRVASRVTEDADEHATVIIGSVIDETSGDELIVTVIATGFPQSAPLERAENTYQHLFKQQTPSTNLYHTSSTPQHHESSSSTLIKEHPLREMLPSLEKRLKDQYALPQEEFEVPTILRKLKNERSPSEK